MKTCALILSRICGRSDTVSRGCRAGVNDSTVAERARRERRILVTHDSDFANIVRFPPRSHSGIIILRIHPPRLSLLIDSLTRFLDEHPARKIKGATFIVRSDSYLEQR